jgi:hypothetical protein
MIGIRFCPVSAARARGIVAGRAKFFVGLSTFENTPWRPFAPLLLVYSWGSFGFLPLPVFTGFDHLEEVSLVLQFLGIAYCAWKVRGQFGTAFLLPDSAFFASRFCWAHCVRAHALLGVASVALMGAAVCLGVFTLEHQSGGFLRVRPSGVYTEARVYEMQEARIYLLPSVHIAHPTFYNRLMQQMPVENAVILPEGVTDKKGILRHGIDHSVAAKSVGLTEQPPLADPRKMAIHNCDADISDFQPRTQNVLRIAGEAISAIERRDLSALVALSTQTNVNFKSEDINTLDEDIVGLRNERVLGAIQDEIGKHAHIGVPWGAAHMVGIERSLLAKGAKQIRSERVQVFAWKDLKFALP